MISPSITLANLKHKVARQILPFITAPLQERFKRTLHWAWGNQFCSMTQSSPEYIQTATTNPLFISPIQTLTF